MTKVTKSTHSDQLIWQWVIDNGIVVTLAVICLLAGTWPGSVSGAPLLFTAEPMIVSQQLLSGVCTDPSGTQRNDLDEWTSASGACDRIVCHVEPSGNYTVTHSCRPREPSENPDTANCVWVSNSSQVYPDCCPKLSCGTAVPLTTINPLTCYNLASSYACGVWYNLTSGCNDTSVDTYNTSRTFCRQTCNLC